MMGAILSFTLLLVGGREMGGQLDTFEIMMYRSFIGIVIVLAVGGLSGTLNQIRTNRLKLHLGRNLLHFMGQNLWFYAVVFIPLSQLVAFEFTTPLWVLALAPFFLKEKLSWPQILSAVIGFIGILVVARPGAAEFSWPLMAAIFCAVGFAGAILTTKHLTSDQSVTCILFWLVVIQAVLGVLAAGADGAIAFPRDSARFWIFIVAAGGLSAHFCLTRALALAPAVIVTPMDFLRLPVVALIGFLIYEEVLDPLVLLGAALIIGANLFNLFMSRKNRRQLASDRQTR